eukprot:6217585-Pyramimonas_sp.AAC.1
MPLGRGAAGSPSAIEPCAEPGRRSRAAGGIAWRGPPNTHPQRALIPLSLIPYPLIPLSPYPLSLIPDP